MKRTARDVLADVRALAVEYYRLTGKSLGVTGKVGEFEAAAKMELELGTARTDGYDAIRHDGPYRQIQIKSRWRPDGVRPQDRVGKINISKEFDSVMRRIFDSYTMGEAAEAPASPENVVGEAVGSISAMMEKGATAETDDSDDFEEMPDSGKFSETSAGGTPPRRRRRQEGQRR